MLDFFFYILVPVTLFVVYYLASNLISKLEMGKSHSDSFKAKVNNSCYKASFIIVPICVLLWAGMAYELFDIAGRQSKVGPIVISILLILPVSVFGGSLYILIFIYHKVKNALSS